MYGYYKDVEITSISARLGHSKVSTTLDIYAHTLDKSSMETANTMNNILNCL